MEVTLGQVFNHLFCKYYHILLLSLSFWGGSFTFWVSKKQIAMLKWAKITTFAYEGPDCKNTVFNPPFILTAINIINTLVDQYTWLRSGRHRDGHKLRALSHVAPRTCVAGKRSIRVNFQMDSRGRNRKKREKSTLSRLFDWTWAFTETLVSKKTSKTNFAKMCSMSNKFKTKGH